MTKRTMNMGIPGERKRGRPKKRLRHNIEEEMDRMEQVKRISLAEIGGGYWCCQQLPHNMQELLEGEKLTLALKILVVDLPLLF